MISLFLYLMFTMFTIQTPIIFLIAYYLLLNIFQHCSKLTKSSMTLFVISVYIQVNKQASKQINKQVNKQVYKQQTSILLFSGELWPQSLTNCSLKYMVESRPQAGFQPFSLTRGKYQYNLLFKLIIGDGSINRGGHNIHICDENIVG